MLLYYRWRCGWRDCDYVIVLQVEVWVERLIICYCITGGGVGGETDYVIVLQVEVWVARLIVCYCIIGGDVGGENDRMLLYFRWRRYWWRL